MGKYFVRARTKPSVDLLTLCPQLTVRKKKEAVFSFGRIENIFSVVCHTWGS